MKQAHYDPRNLGHMGLASTAYCHFTSPIRRYPDLVVHRALLHELGVTDEQAPTDLADLAEHTSEREREAAEIEHIADDICAAWLLERRLFDRGWDEPWDGEIIGVIPSGLFARFGEVFEGYVPARRLAGDYFELNDAGTALTGRRGGRTYRLGDPIEVAGRGDPQGRRQGRARRPGSRIWSAARCPPKRRNPMPLLRLVNREARKTASRLWWLYVLSGFGWLLVALIVFRFDWASVAAIGTLFGVVAVIAGAMEFAVAASSRGGWRWLRYLIGTVFIAGGIVSFFTPGATRS